MWNSLWNWFCDLVGIQRPSRATAFNQCEYARREQILVKAQLAAYNRIVQKQGRGH